MAQIERTVEVFTFLPLDSIKDDWVKAAWESDFADLESSPSGFEDVLQDDGYCVIQLKSCNDLLKEWLLQEEADTGEGLWTVMVENDISYKSIIALLAFLIESGGKITSIAAQREAAVLSASLYFRFVAVPGSSAFRIYNPELFLKAVDLLKMWTKLGSSKRKRSLSPVPSSQGHKHKGRKKSKSNQMQTANPDLEVSEFPPEAEEEDVELTPQEMSRLRVLMKNLMQDLVVLLERYSLKQSESTARYLVQIFAELTKHDAEVLGNVFDQWPPTERMSLPCLAFKGLSLLCIPLHGHVVSLTTAVFHQVLPAVLMLIGSNKAIAAQTIPRPVLTARDNAVEFVKYLLKKGGDRIYPAVRTLIQHVCTKVPDRAEYRTKVAEGVVPLLCILPDEAYARMMEWIVKLSTHSKINNRGFALDIVTQLLSLPERIVEDVPEEFIQYTTHRLLLGVLIGRCSDVAPTVRTRAIAGFSQCLSSRDEGIIGAIKEIVTPKTGHRNGPPRLVPTPGVEVRKEPRTESSSEGKSLEDSSRVERNDEMNNTNFNFVELTPGFNPDVLDNDGILSMLRRRSQDEKVGVRKAALQALENVIRFEAPNYRKQDVEVLEKRCADPALSVRKQAMQSVTDLLFSMPADTHIHSTWLNGVLPLVIDRESTLQEKCLETLEEIFIQNIVPHHRSKEPNHLLVWSLLRIMTRPENTDLRRYLQKACQHWSRAGRLKPGIVTSLQTHLETENNEGAWMLLAEISSAFPKMDNKFLITYWENHSSQMSESSHQVTWRRVLTVMGSIAKHITAETRSEFIVELKERLMKFDSPPELIAVVINTLSKLCEAEKDGQDSRREKESWCVDLLKECDEYLSRIILDEENIICSTDEDQIVRHLFTLGEIAQLCPAKTPKHVYMLVQSLIAAPCITGESMTDSTNTVTCSQPEGGHNKSSEDNKSGGHNKSSDDGRTSAMSTQSSGSSGSQATQMSSQQLQPLSQFRGSKMSNRIRAYAFITLGKLCLQNENLAKKCIAALARELEICTDSIIRNNVIVIMCDLCVRYTTLVDRYITNIAVCLKDASPLIRKQTLTLMTRLLQEDFLKWKGVLFYRFITTLLDDNQEIREFAEFCLVHLLLRRQPAMFFQHFVECIFHFNAYDGHSVYNKFSQTEREKQMFSCHGKQNLRKRQKLYLFMLEHMMDEQRFKLSAKICQDVLCYVVDGSIPLDEDVSAILQDSLMVLSSKEIKLASMKVKPNENEEQDMATVVMATAKKTFLTHIVKKNVIENIVPIVISLKHMLERHRSPVLKYVMLYLAELMKDYKNEVKDILSADKQLAHEIEFDMRKFDEQQANAEKQRRENTPTQRKHMGLAGSPLTPASPRSPAVGSPRSTAGQTPRSSTAGHGLSADVQEESASHEVGKSPTGIQGKSPAGVQGTSPAATVEALSPGVTSPKSNSPSVSRSPLADVPSTPKQMNENSLAGTPARNTPLSTLAILNSARKVAERARFLREVRDSPRQKGSTKSVTQQIRERTKSGVTWHDRESQSSETEMLKDSSVESAKTPRNFRTKSRAISTPSGKLGNITFVADQNVTLIPPSPIANSSQLADTDTEGEDSICTRSKSKYIVYMFSPEKQPPKPRQWNVKSPSVPVGEKNKENVSTRSSDDGLSIDSSASQSGAPLRRRSSRRKNKS
ncbi:condensin-2 complex subunit D3-like [Gigantopelta aegis]|uniref:condensin-2 complex subunit D3-like n=1 Tax=Gigantopelta aegis TaxID=1735272 RepID=UPI001B88D579|nr:condensin-2 complex subunit D3-like [Gigantopelta aegis]